MKFEAEEPEEMSRNKQNADRSQGAARAISVRIRLVTVAWTAHNR